MQLNTYAQQELLLLLLAVSCCLHRAVAQDPVGSFAECGPGRTFRVSCYFNHAGYLADVVYRNTIPPTDIAICNAPQQQLHQSQATVLEVSASDSIINMRVCGDGRGVRGLQFDTHLGLHLVCGDTHGQCTHYSSRGTYPLGGFSGTCAAVSRQKKEGRKYTQVTQVFQACWNTQTPAAPAVCPPGAGSPGGGSPCVACQPGWYSPGGKSPCIRCPDGRTTIAPASRSCGCFPGQGVYGNVYQDPDICETCAAGTYSIGGSLSPCQPCSTNAFSFLTSAPGSTSIADCTCAAGYGSTDANPKACSVCPLGTYNAGPMPRAQAAAALQALVDDHQHNSKRSDGGNSNNSCETTGGSSSSSSGNDDVSSTSSSSSIGDGSSGEGEAGLAAVVSLHTADAKHLLHNQADTTGVNSRAVDGVLQQQPAEQQQLQHEPQLQHEGPQQHTPSTPAEPGVAVAAAVLPQQTPDSWEWMRGSGINPVFYEPTYNPCTPCGPACYTDSRRSTSPSQCKCLVVPPPGPKPPIPAPPPTVPTCITWLTDALDAALEECANIPAQDLTISEIDLRDYWVATTGFDADTYPLSYTWDTATGSSFGPFTDPVVTCTWVIANLLNQEVTLTANSNTTPPATLCTLPAYTILFVAQPTWPSCATCNILALEADLPVACSPTTPLPISLSTYCQAADPAYVEQFGSLVFTAASVNEDNTAQGGFLSNPAGSINCGYVQLNPGELMDLTVNGVEAPSTCTLPVQDQFAISDPSNLGCVTCNTEALLAEMQSVCVNSDATINVLDPSLCTLANGFDGTVLLSSAPAGAFYVETSELSCEWVAANVGTRVSLFASQQQEGEPLPPECNLPVRLVLTIPPLPQGTRRQQAGSQQPSGPPGGSSNPQNIRGGRRQAQPQIRPVAQHAHRQSRRSTSPAGSTSPLHPGGSASSQEDARRNSGTRRAAAQDPHMHPGMAAMTQEPATQPPRTLQGQHHGAQDRRGPTKG